MLFGYQYVFGKCLFKCSGHFLIKLFILFVDIELYEFFIYFGYSVQFIRSALSDSATPWTAARQVSLSITNSWSLLKLMSIESVMPSNHLILSHPLVLLPSIFSSIRSFQMSQFFASGGQSIGVSASASVLPMSIQD